jgi:hypothetical protein
VRTTEKHTFWVVYRMTIHGKKSGMSAVCEQSEWEAMERAQPGYHTLVLAGIANEGEAERLARSVLVDGNTGKPPEPKPRRRRLRGMAPPPADTMPVESPVP